MKKYIYIFLFLVILIISCINDATVKNIEIQGHRGVRGYAPENTIEGFLKALDYDIDVLEMDVVISGDGQVVVSHEPWFNHDICTKPNGRPALVEEEDAVRMYALNYAQISEYDCGKRGNPDFPEQEKIAARKPLLQDVFRTIESHLKENNLPLVGYNIEIKSRPMWDEVFTPLPAKFTQLVYDDIQKAGLKERVCIQSFDMRSLQALHNIDASMTTALLISNNDGIDQNLKALGFVPDIYSPNYILLNASEVRRLQEKNIRVIPWTVNEKTHIRRVAEWGVDGIISDYPDRVHEVLNELF